MKKKYLTCLYVVRFNGTTGSYPSNDTAPALQHQKPDIGIKKLEAGVLEKSERGMWESAYLYDANAPKGTPPIYTYHHSTGTIRHTKEVVERMRLSKKVDDSLPYRAYIIPTPCLQQQGRKPQTRFVANIEDARSYLVENVLKILVYRVIDNALTKTFLNV